MWASDSDVSYVLSHSASMSNATIRGESDQSAVSILLFCVFILLAVLSREYNRWWKIMSLYCSIGDTGA